MAISYPHSHRCFVRVDSAIIAFFFPGIAHDYLALGLIIATAYNRDIIEYFVASSMIGVGQFCVAFERGEAIESIEPIGIDIDLVKEVCNLGEKQRKSLTYKKFILPRIGRLMLILLFTIFLWPILVIYIAMSPWTVGAEYSSEDPYVVAHRVGRTAFASSFVWAGVIIGVNYALLHAH